MTGLCAHDTDTIGLAGNTASPIHSLDPRAKVCGLVLVTLVAVSASFALWPVFVACGAVLAAVAAVAGVPPGVLWRRGRVVLPLVLLAAAFLPFFRSGGAEWTLGPLTVSEVGLETFVAVAAKATIGTVSAVLLGATTTFPDVLRALERLRVPALFVQIAAFMYRYLFVIVDETRRMRAALVSRGYRPRHALQAGAIGRVASAMFVRTYARGERVYLAMLARGYRGAMPQLEALVFGRRDLAFLLLLGLPLALARLAVEVPV
jgi:cobalt/nickel transport system permease protein